MEGVGSGMTRAAGEGLAGPGTGVGVTSQQREHIGDLKGHVPQVYSISVLAGVVSPCTILADARTRLSQHLAKSPVRILKLWMTFGLEGTPPSRPPVFPPCT